MPAAKRYGLYVFNISKLKDDVLWFETEKERDKEYSKLKSNKNLRIEKRNR